MTTSAKPSAKRHSRLGSNFDDFLRDEGLLEEAEAIAIKRVLALKLADLMQSQNLSKAAAAGRMKSSRRAVEQVLDPENASVSLLTLNRAARAVGRRPKVELVPV
jgi:antitoxin HicB